MIFIENRSTDPCFNLAMEEYVLMNLTQLDDVFFLWQDEPTVVVGKNQNTIEEINRSYIKEQDVNVVRRLSGGGAVYHDLGNLNFTFIVNEEHKNSFDFQKFTRPVIEALDTIGIKAENNGRNDITIEGRKFSGNAQYRYHNRLLHHGTLLFDSRLEDMVEALNVSEDKISSKGIKSVRSRVTNISEHLQKAMDVSEFREILKNAIWKSAEQAIEYKLSESDLKVIENLRDNKYRSWEWVYGSSPAFNLQRSRRFDWGNLDIRLNVKNGYIADCAFYGDFFTNADISELGRKLSAAAMEEDSLRQKVREIDLRSYLPAIDEEEFITLLLG